VWNTDELKFFAAISLHEASSIGDVSLETRCRRRRGFYSRRYPHSNPAERDARTPHRGGIATLPGQDSAADSRAKNTSNQTGIMARRSDRNDPGIEGSSLTDSVVISAVRRSKIKETNLVAFKRDDDGLAQIKPFG
jgi:hypothetical protein